MKLHLRPRPALALTFAACVVASVSAAQARPALDLDAPGLEQLREHFCKQVRLPERLRRDNNWRLLLRQERRCDERDS